MDPHDVRDLRRAGLKHHRGDVLGSKDLGFLAGVPRVEVSGNNSGTPDVLENPLFAEERV